MADGLDWQEIAASAGLMSAATTILAWFTGRKLQRAAAIRAEAETDKLRVEAERLRAVGASDFEAAVNERVRIIFEQQNKRIAELTEEVHGLRAQVETLTRELQCAREAVASAPSLSS